MWGGQVISQCGTWMQRVAQAWLVLQLSDSPLALGTVTALQFVPLLVLSLFGGVVADRLPKRRVLIATQATMAGQAIALALLTAFNVVELWHVYLLSLLLGLATAFDNPTRQAFLVDLVGPEDLPNAVALNSSLFNTARVAGPALGGLVVATGGVTPCFWLNALSFSSSIGALMAMRFGEPLTTHSSRRGALLTELREGLSFALHSRAICPILILCAGIGTFGYNFNVFIPLLARYVLEAGPVGLGTLLSSLGIGSVVAALGVASRRVATERDLFVGAAAFGTLLLLVAVSHWLAVTAALLALTGSAGILFTTTANTRMQLSAPPELRGRLMGLYSLFMLGTTPIGSLTIGSLSEHFGVQVALGICAALCLTGLLLGLVYVRLHDGPTPQPGPSATKSGLAP